MNEDQCCLNKNKIKQTKKTLEDILLYQLMTLQPQRYSGTYTAMSGIIVANIAQKTIKYKKTFFKLPPSIDYPNVHADIYSFIHCCSH